MEATFWLRSFPVPSFSEISRIFQCQIKSTLEKQSSPLPLWEVLLWAPIPNQQTPDPSSSKHVGHWTYSHFQKLEFKLTDPKARLKASSLICGSNKNIGMLCMQELFFFLGEWINWNIVSDVYIFTKGKKSINAEKNENVELTHTQVVRCRLCVLCE